MTCGPMRMAWLACLTGGLVSLSALANTFIFRGGVIQKVDLEKMTFVVAETSQRSYDVTEVQFCRTTEFSYGKGSVIFILDGVPALPKEALKTGNKLKRLYIKGDFGCVELFSADAPSLKAGDAQSALNLLVAKEVKGADGKTQRSCEPLLDLRLEYKDSKLVQSFAVAAIGGAHPPLYDAPRVEADLSGLHLTDGKLSGEIKCQGQVSGSFALDAELKNAMWVGTFKGRSGAQDVSGVVSGEVDYQSPADEPLTAYVRMQGCLPGGKPEQNELLLKLVFKDANAVEAQATSLRGADVLTATTDQVQLKLTPGRITGSLAVKVESKVLKSGACAIGLASRWGTMGRTTSVGSGLILSEWTSTLDGQPCGKGGVLVFVRNNWRMSGKSVATPANK